MFSTNLFTEYWVYGTILDVSKLAEPLSSDEKRVLEEHVLERDVRLYLVPGFLIYYDSLYLDKDSWKIFRDAGVFPDEYRVKIKLLRAEIREAGKPFREVELYPYRAIETRE
mgnify:CR=1 FL=1